ncbi:MAG: glycosyltransferase family 2 protein [Planctomycetia bacterium]|nr:glycosyltransferase family 2 protein [Planctomycetia bacterium]
MPKLSIVIPALDSLNLLEGTLVSVLQNRPDDCEVVVLLNRPYDDPYQLGEEVRFIVVREGTDTASSLEAGLRLCRGEVLHILAAGAEVDEGWTSAALGHFYDNRVAAVAPLVLRSREDEDVVCSVGVEYGVGGSRRRRGCGRSAEEFTRNIDVLGPTLIAAFYRRDVLLALPSPFDSSVTDGLLDVDLALQIKAAGYRSVFEPGSVAYRSDATLRESSPLASGRGAERLFWRNAHSIGWIRSLAMHGFAVAGELVSRRAWSDKLLRLAGRGIGCCDIVSFRRHRRALAALGRPGLAYAVVSTGDRIRIDGPHPRSPSGVKAPSVIDMRRDGDSERAA